MSVEKKPHSTMDILDCLTSIDRFNFIFGLCIFKFNYNEGTYKKSWWKIVYCFLFASSTTGSFVYIIYVKLTSTDATTILQLFDTFSKILWATVPVLIFLTLVLQQRQAICGFSDIFNLPPVSGNEIQKVKKQQSFLLLFSVFLYGPFLSGFYFLFLDIEMAYISFHVCSVFGYHLISLNILWCCIYQNTMVRIFEILLAQAHKSFKEKLFFRPPILRQYLDNFETICRVSLKGIKYFEPIFPLHLFFSVNVYVTILFYSRFIIDTNGWNGWLRIYVLIADFPLLAIYIITYRVGRLFATVSIVLKPIV